MPQLCAIKAPMEKSHILDLAGWKTVKNMHCYRALKE